MTSGVKQVFIVIPAYNEGTVIRSVVKNSKKIFSKHTGYKYTVVVVNDGSRDNTAAEARAGGAVVINHVINSGAGAATATGLAYAERHGADIAATMDADGQHAAEDVKRGIEEIVKTNSDLLVGSRLIDSEGMSRVKVLGNKGLTFITFLVFGVKSTDSQSGLRIFSPKAIKVLYWRSQGYEFCSEMLWRASQLKLKVNEYPIQAIYTDYSVSKGQNNWNAINIIKNLFARRISEIFR